MKAIILAAGYATRMGELTRNIPKPLLRVCGKEIMTYLIEKIESVKEIDDVYVVTNAKFSSHFERWAGSFNSQTRLNLYVVNDGTTSNEDRLGAIGDLKHTLDKHSIDDDVLVLAGDNLFDFGLDAFVSFFLERKGPSIETYDLGDKSLIIKKYSSIEVGENGNIISMEEKPEEPKSSIAGIPFYIYPKSALPLIRRYIGEGNNPDAPGYLMSWMASQTTCYAHMFEGKRYDIGTPESYRQVCEIFEQRR